MKSSGIRPLRANHKLPHGGLRGTKAVKLLVAVVSCLCFVWHSYAAPAARTPESAALDSALGLIKLSREQFRVDPGIMLTRPGQLAKLPVFEQWFNEPLRIPAHETHLRDAIIGGIGKLDPLFAVSASLIASGTRRDLIGPNAAEKYAALVDIESPLASALHRLDSAARGPAVDRVPAELQTVAATILLAINDALAWRKMALRNVDEQAARALLNQPLEFSDRRPAAVLDTIFPESYLRYYEGIENLERVDLALLCASADDLCSVIDAAISALDTIEIPEALNFMWRTQHGDVIIRGARASHGMANDEEPLLALGMDGNSHHGGNGRGTVSVVIDVGGDDLYVNSGGESGLWCPAGAGILGINIVADLSGNDLYTSTEFYAQGCGLGGVGILWDRAGDDRYHALGGAQGFANYGVGILCDVAGNDFYHAYNCAQGCGLTRGCGMLVDFFGDDRYIADDDTILFPSPQSKDHNANMCQGAGYGVRRDYIDAHSVAGGVGLLVDGGGTDDYWGGVFCQAVGYWYGIGVLDDRGGNDRYRGVWYTQSATAHMGVSCLVDSGGDDVYQGVMTMGACAAHDFSVSVFVETAGNDSFQHKANCLGTALNSSVSLMIDRAGNDVYSCENGLGYAINSAAAGIRSEAATYGLFLDLDGTDVYPGSSRFDNGHWVQPDTSDHPDVRAAGLDYSIGALPPK